MNRKNKLSISEADIILSNVLKDNNFEKNTIPLSELISYANYQKEKNKIQRTALKLIIVLFLLLPFCFVRPSWEISHNSEGTRSLPQYKITANSFVPVKKINAFIGKYHLPIYQENANTYMIEPAENGTMHISITLINNQSDDIYILVDDVDSQPPELLKTINNDNFISIYAKDSGVGIDFTKVYAVDNEQNIISPIAYDSNSGVIDFSYPDMEITVIIPDKIGNNISVKLIP